jgi:hypothetical protein
MQRVLILSKTHMNNQVCVGGILEDGKYVRLLDSSGHNQPVNSPFQVRQFWQIDFQPRPSCRAPHVEDVLVSNMVSDSILKPEISISEYLLDNLKVKVWRGSPETLFDGSLNWTASGSGFVSQSNIPANSVGFWIADKDLVRHDYNGVRYQYNSPLGWRNIKFVGFKAPVSKIPAGTLIRVSLARWWKQDPATEERCFLQLSGWYDYEEAVSDDLPF